MDISNPQVYYITSRCGNNGYIKCSKDKIKELLILVDTLFGCDKHSSYEEVYEIPESDIDYYIDDNKQVTWAKESTAYGQV